MNSEVQGESSEADEALIFWFFFIKEKERSTKNELIPLNQKKRKRPKNKYSFYIESKDGANDEYDGVDDGIYHFE